VIVASNPEVTIVIPTRDRVEELCNALDSACLQTTPSEIIVMDDGSVDCTSDIVASRFPEVRLYRSPISIGPITQRNRAAALARASVMVSIDDDCVFPSCRTIEQTLPEFINPTIGAVSIPRVDIKYSSQILVSAPGSTGTWITSDFGEGSVAIRRDLFLRLGGYREFFVRQAEASDYCVRMLNAGYVTCVGRADPIHHLESPKRDRRRIVRYDARNSLLYAWYNVPTPFLPGHLIDRAARIMRRALFSGYPWSAMQGIFQGLAAIPGQAKERKPMTITTYKIAKMLLQKGVLNLAEIEPLLARPSVITSDVTT